MENKNLISLKEFHIPRWNELPDVDLYLDQVVKLVNSCLAAGGYKKDDNGILTKTMINNYVKNNLIEPPVKKQYSKIQLAKLFVICILKQVYSMQNIKSLIDIAVVGSDVQAAYDKFCSLFEEALQCTYEKRDFIRNNAGSDRLYLLKAVLLSCSYKIYVDSIIEPERSEK